MKKETLDERYTVILKIQQQMSLLSPGAYEYEVLDKAYELALSPNRKIDDYFLHNLKRDAKRILKRQKESGPNIICLQQNHSDDSDDFLEDIYPIGDHFINDCFAEEDILLFQQLCLSIHPKAPDILLDHINGYHTSDISIRHSLHESRVKKIRVSIKDAIMTHIKN